MTILRRNFLKKSLTAAAALPLASPFGFNILKHVKEENPIIGHNGFQYKMDRDWAQISSVRTPILNCHEMVMDSQGRLIMLGDDIHNNILIFDKSGKLLDHWGTQYPGGHGLTLITEVEDDYLFIVDCGWFLDKNGKWQKQAGRVVKTTIDGRMIFNIGHPATIGAYGPFEPFMPTEVAVSVNGNFYVADGYGSDYILQYSYNGEFIRKFGGRNNENPDHNLVNAHGVAIDNRDPGNPLLICTSRTENCFKFFTLDGEYVSTTHLPGAFICRPVIAGENIYAGVCWSETRDGKKWHPNTGFVTILDRENKVISNPGGEAPEYKDGKLQPMFQSKDKPFNHGHDVCIDEDMNLYICQWNAHKTPPIKLVRV